MQGITWASTALLILQIKKLRFREVDTSPGRAMQSWREMKQVHMQVTMTTEPMPIPSDPDEGMRCLLSSLTHPGVVTHLTRASVALLVAFKFYLSNLVLEGLVESIVTSIVE